MSSKKKPAQAKRSWWNRLKTGERIAFLTLLATVLTVPSGLYVFWRKDEPVRKGVVIGKDATDSTIESHVPADYDSAVEVGGNSVRTGINTTVGNQPGGAAIPDENELKRVRWPFDGNHLAIEGFFNAHFREAANLNGLDRFFLY